MLEQNEQQAIEMSGRRTKKATKTQPVRRRNPPPQESNLPGSVNPNAKKYSVPVLKNLALACIAVALFFAVVSQSDRIASAMQTIPPRVSDAESKASEARIVGNNVPIRAVPKINGKIMERAVWGTSVEVISRDGEWAQIRSGRRGAIGWISQTDLKF